MIYSDSNRVAFIDIMKAITIFLVVLGHSTICSPWLIRWIYAFHMPAFFAVYGLTYHPQTHAQRRWLTPEFLLSKVQRLLVPCFVWGLLYSSFSFKSAILVLWGSQSALIQADSVSSLWFLSCMFLTVCAFELLMWSVFRLRPLVRGILLGGVALVGFGIGCLLPRLTYGYPLGLDAMFPALSFVIIGYGLRCLIQQVPALNDEKPVVWFILFLAGALLTFTFIPNLRFITKNNVDFASRSFGNPALYVLAALAGIVVLVALSVLLSRFSFSQKLFCFGKYSLAILVLHKPILLYLSDFLAARGFGSTWTAIPLALGITLLCFLAAKLLEVLAPTLIGVRPKKEA